MIKLTNNSIRSYASHGILSWSILARNIALVLHICKKSPQMPTSPRPFHSDSLLLKLLQPYMVFYVISEWIFRLFIPLSRFASYPHVLNTHRIRSVVSLPNSVRPIPQNFIPSSAISQTSVLAEAIIFRLS